MVDDAEQLFDALWQWQEMIATARRLNDALAVSRIQSVTNHSNGHSRWFCDLPGRRILHCLNTGECLITLSARLVTLGARLIADRCIVGAPVQEDDGSDEDERGESWSCPDTRPELW